MCMFTMIFGAFSINAFAAQTSDDTASLGCYGCDLEYLGAQVALKDAMTAAEEYMKNPYEYTKSSFSDLSEMYSNAEYAYKNHSDYEVTELFDISRALWNAIACMEPAQKESDYFVIGNVNCDSYVNIKDATAIQKYLAGLELFYDDTLKLADTNDDGKVNIKDATTIQKYIADIECVNVIGKYLWQLDENRTHITIDDVVYEVCVGDRITYTVSLATAELIENIQGFVTYDDDILELVRVIPDDPDDSVWQAEAERYCPNLETGCVFNADIEDKVRFNGSCLDGYDFTRDEKVLLTLDFVVEKPGEVEIDFVMEYMTICGDGTEYYFYNGEPVITDGIRITEILPLH